jgi:acyl-CoA synthetase (AMP-forming)/AMP-acid ligase II
MENQLRASKLIAPGFDGWICGQTHGADPCAPQRSDYRFIAREEGIRPLTDRLDEIAGLQPDKIAVDDGVNRLTYSQFRDAVYDAVSQIVSACPVGRPVAAILRNDILFPVVQFACLISARPSGLVDLSHPVERQRVIVENLRPGCVILPAGAVTGCDTTGIPTLELDPLNPRPAPRPDFAPNENSPVMIAFTSGSTGDPKGVAVSWQTVAETARTQTNALQIMSDDVILSAASLSVMGGRDTVVAVLAGATLRLVDVKDAGLEGLLEIMSANKITRFGFIPSALKALVRLPKSVAAMSHLRTLDLGGEPVGVADIEIIRANLPPDCKICLLFGATETTATFRYFVPQDDLRDPLPLGYLEPERRIAIIDEDGQAVTGEAGELVVADHCNALGEWKSGELAPGPFIPDGQGRNLYFTGDMLELRPDGLALFHGRRDRMVKIIGLKAQLAEVEAALLQLRAVQDAAVVATRREGSSPTLVAFLTAEPGEEPCSDGEVRRTVSKATAPHMVPQLIRWIGALPRLANQKPDLVALEKLAEELIK